MRPDGILRKLEKAGYEAYYVGGCVRDGLMGRPIHDWDITTNALPEAVMEIFPHTIPTGLAHGTVTVMDDGVQAEVTTFRLDGTYLDGRHPAQVQFVPNLRDDLARRDFTVNAMAMDVNGTITDLFGGRADMQKRILRCVGDPETRFREDALRMLRAYRFAAQLGFTIVDETRDAIQICAPLAEALSRERVSQEAEKTICSEHPDHFGTMMELGLLRACGLEGHCDCSSLSAFPDTPEARWTGLKLLCPSFSPKCFRLSKKLEQQILAAAAAGLCPRTRSDWKKLMADAGIKTAILLGHMQKDRIPEEILASGECVSLRTLAVSGTDFPDLSGKAIGQTLSLLLQHVLEHPEDNRRQTLLDLERKNRC